MRDQYLSVQADMLKIAGVKKFAYGHDGHERMQVNMHSELLVAYEVVLEPTARVAPYSTESSS
jgi:hypothetical protein